MKVLIAGGGSTLFHLARRFIGHGHDVTLVDRDEQDCVRLARQLTATVVHGEASDPRILEEAGVMGVDAVLAMTPHDEDNLIICQLASLRFGVPRAVALANDPDNAEVFEQLGVTAFSTTDIVGGLIEEQTQVEQITSMLAVGEGKITVTEVVVDERAPAVDVPLADLGLPANALVAAVVRDGTAHVPSGDTRLKVGDRALLVSLAEAHEATLRAFTGEKS